MIVVADTTPIITLIKLNHLDLLHQLFDDVNIPKAVYEELTSNINYLNEADIILKCEFLTCIDSIDRQTTKFLRKVMNLDAGESEAIALADEISADLLIIDERKGRNVAKKLGIKFIGTIGILLQAFDMKLLSKLDIVECVKILKQCNIRISESLIDLIYNYTDINKEK